MGGVQLARRPFLCAEDGREAQYPCDSSALAAKL